MDKNKKTNIPKPDSVEKPEPSDEVKSQLPIPKGWKRGLLSHHHGANGFCYIYRIIDD